MIFQNSANSGAIIAAHVGSQTELWSFRELIVAGQSFHLFEHLQDLFHARGTDYIT